MNPVRRFKPITRNLFLLNLGAAAALSGCGGGGSGGTGISAGSAAPAAPAAVTYTGPVSGLGSIVVNGVRFETLGATVHDADDPYGSTEYAAPIRLGTVVSVSGDVDDVKGTGSATRIRIVGGLRGTVSGVDLNAGTLNVGGQTVKVTGTTVFDSGLSGLAALAAGSYVEVYGLPQADGSFTATRIEVRGNASGSVSGVALRGIVASVGPGSLILRNGLSVSYAADMVSPAGAGIAAGSDVRILAAAAPVNGQVVASRVLVLGAVTLVSGSANPVSGSSVKIKGIVDSVSGSTISVSGTPVSLGGMAAPAIGSFVEVKGSLSGGTLVASRIEIEGSGRSLQVLGANGQVAYRGTYKQELYGVVANFSSLSSFTVQGVPVDASQARFEYGVSSLGNNSYVEVKGTYQNGVLLATKVELKGATASLTSGAGGVLSSGSSKFEIYATLSCVSYPSSCTLSGDSVLNANLSGARWDDGGRYVQGGQLYVEAKGYLDASGVFQVVEIEAKRGS